MTSQHTQQLHGASHDYLQVCPTAKSWQYSTSSLYTHRWKSQVCTQVSLLKTHSHTHTARLESCTQQNSSTVFTDNKFGKQEACKLGEFHVGQARTCKLGGFPNHPASSHTDTDCTSTCQKTVYTCIYT